MWLRVLELYERTWVGVLCMSVMCCCFIIDFKDMYDDVISIVNLC